MTVWHDIVVVAASGGGVGALEQLVAGFPAEFPASVFITLHIPPDPESQLPAILRRRSRFPVVRVDHRERIRPGHIYIAPPDYHLIVGRGYLDLSHGPKENGHRPAADPMFCSAAQTYGRRVIGVILSGALDDGTVGLKDVKLHGGLAVVQDPQDAAFPGMPASAIRSVPVDHVVPVSQMAALLEGLVRTPMAKNGNDRQRNPDLVKHNSERAHAVLICPDCGGPLQETQEGNVVKFRCRTGHAYSMESLLKEEGDGLERALWASVRSLQDKAMVETKLADQARRAGQTKVADLFQKRSRETSRQARLLDEALVLQKHQGAQRSK